MSVAEHVTAVDPRLNKLPGGREHEDDRIPELSTALNAQLANALGEFPFVGVTVNGVDDE